jgi:hypothetical protein
VLKQPALCRLHELKKRRRKMKKLFYRLSSTRSFVKLFSMQARLERRRVLFSKSSICLVVALAAFMSLGAFVLPQVGHAQDCIWDCDLGSDFLNTPADNSPGFSIVYCFDQPCAEDLGIFTGTIPHASVQQCPSMTVGSVETCLKDIPQPFTACPVNIKITGNVVAVLSDQKGLHPESAAEASLAIVVKGLNNCSTETPPSTLSRVTSVNESPGAVFAANSNITILATPILNVGNSNLTAIGWTGCTNDKKTGKLLTNCSFPLGIDVSKTATALSAKFPAPEGLFVKVGEVYRGIGVGRAVAMRMCKGNANSTDPSTIGCTVGGSVAVGGFNADAVFNFDGNWSGANTKTFNPKSGTGPFDIITPLFDQIDFTDPQHPVTASANGGTPLDAASCNLMPSQDTLRCFFPANQLLPNGCKNGDPVNIVVSGNVSFPDNPLGFVKFLSTDSPTCNSNK